MASCPKGGFPVLIKAAAGGSGKGMRRVDQSADFMAALASARRSEGRFWDDEAVLVEKYFYHPVILRSSVCRPTGQYRASL
ncbi:MAG: hypothetical protein IPP67_00305 [Rhodospirillaceae bacterium]|nr:hypothetical protein [Rhodospirillaceae bacterium]